MRRFILPDCSVRDYSHEEYDLLPLPGVSPADDVIKAGTQDINKWHEVPYEKYLPAHPAIRDGVIFWPRVDEGALHGLCIHQVVYVSELEDRFFVRTRDFDGGHDSEVFNTYEARRFRSDLLAEMCPVLNAECLRSGACSKLRCNDPNDPGPHLIESDIPPMMSLCLCYQCAASKIYSERPRHAFVNTSTKHQCFFDSTCDLCKRKCSSYGGDYIPEIYVMKDTFEIDDDDDHWFQRQLEQNKIWVCNFCRIARHLPSQLPEQRPVRNEPSSPPPLKQLLASMAGGEEPSWASFDGESMEL